MKNFRIKIKIIYQIYINMFTISSNVQITLLFDL